jgi:single-stranded DNA-binding protein
VTAHTSNYFQTDQYEKNGEPRYSTKIVVDEFRGTVQFLDKKLEGSAPKKTAKVTHYSFQQEYRLKSLS